MFPRSLILVFSGVIAVALPCIAAPASPDVARAGTHHKHAVQSRKDASATAEYKRVMEKMHKHMAAPRSGSVDVDFVRQMIPHHQAALDMARIELKYGNDAEMKKLAQWIITAQEREIAWMKGWLLRFDHEEVRADAVDYYAPVMEHMHHAMMIEYTGDADVDFARGMIPHHQGALDMAGVWMKNGTNPDLQSLTHNIYTSQSQEITWIQRWLDHHNTH